jgi:cytochrome b
MSNAPVDPARPSAATAAAPPGTRPVRVWDLPTRLFHWALAACVFASVITAKIGGNAMVWHFRLGEAVFALLLFRILWGLVGGHWSRFARLLYGPGALWRYLRGRPRPGEWLDVGHSPLGALAVVAMLALLAVQVGTGLVADDEIANIGPLNRLVATDTGLAATGWHKAWGQWLLLGLIGLHLVAITTYSVRGRPLVSAMLHGDKALPPEVPAAADGIGHRLLALGLFALCAAGVGWVVSAGG